LLSRGGLSVGDHVECETATDEGNGRVFVTRMKLDEGEEGPRPKNRGTVLSNALDRGFTFISNDDGSGDAFLHITTMRDIGPRFRHIDEQVLVVLVLSFGGPLGAFLGA
jgi:cold shock CspA family protein